MAKVIDNKIEKQINYGLKMNYTTDTPLNSYVLPRFDKNDKGEYFYVGNCSVSTLKQYNNYIQVYTEIDSYLKKIYRPVIAKIYRNALNSLIADTSKFRIGQNDYSLSSKLSEKSFTLDSLEDTNTSAYKQTLNFVTKAAYNSKRVKPCIEINDILRENESELSKDSMIYILPVMTDNGVIVTQKQNNKSAIETRFEAITAENALLIKDYLLEATEGLDVDSATQIRNQIEKLFREARDIGESVKAGINNNLHNRLEKLMVDFADLIGVDLSEYSRGNQAQKREGLTDSTPSIYYNEEAPASDFKSFDVSEIMFDGAYKTTPSISDGKIVTRVTPEGMDFSVTLKDNVLFVSNKQSKDELVK